MNYFAEDENKAFLKAFLSNSGDGMNEDYVKSIIKYLKEENEVPDALRAKYSHSDVTCVTDALNIWNEAIVFAWGKTVEGMR